MAGDGIRTDGDVWRAAGAASARAAEVAGAAARQRVGGRTPSPSLAVTRAAPVAPVATATPAAPEAGGGRGWIALAVVSAGTFAIILDQMAGNVAFSFIERAFPATPRTTLAWVSSGNAIASAALLLLAGRLADRYGRRRIFLYGAALFGAVSFVSATAPNPAVLIAARVVQGGGAAMITATAIALILPEFPANRRGLAIGVWGTISSAGAASGPTLGALAIQSIGWRLAFLLNVPLVLVTLVAGPRLLREHRTSPAASGHGAPTPAGGIDLIGTVVGTGAIALLTFAILQGPSWGWGSPRVAGTGVAALVLTVAFLVRCHRAVSPLVDLGLFAHRPFWSANLSQAGTQMAIMAWFLTTPLFIINVWHRQAIVGGLAVAAGMAVSFVSIPVGRWSDSHGYRAILVVGGVLSAAGMGIWVLKVGEEPHLFTWYAAGLMLFGLGAGMVGIVVTNAALAGLPETELAGANAVFQTIRRLVGAIGVAIAVALLGSRSSESVASFRHVWLLIGGGYLFSAVAILTYREQPAHRR